VWYWYNHADELVILGRFREALESLDQAIRVNPRHAESWAKRGQVLRRLGQYPESLIAYDRAVGINAHYGWAWNGRGLTLREMDRREEALASLERAVQQEPTSVWYHFNLIDTLLDLQRKALEDRPHASGRAAINCLGAARASAAPDGRQPAAIDSYERRWNRPDYAWAGTARAVPDSALIIGEALAC
jgi:tetratricopeptide (TPR) repeat protein